MFQTKFVENVKTQILRPVIFLFESHVVMRMWKNTTQSTRTQMTVRRVRIAGWIPKTTNTHSECVILIAFPRKQ